MLFIIMITNSPSLTITLHVEPHHVVLRQKYHNVAYRLVSNWIQPHFLFIFSLHQSVASSNFVALPVQTQGVIQPPVAQVFRTPQSLTPTTEATTKTIHVDRRTVNQGQPADAATLPFYTSPYTMSWFWTTAEPDKELNAHGDKRNTPAAINQEQTTSQPISRNKNSAGKDRAWVASIFSNSLFCLKFAIKTRV